MSPEQLLGEEIDHRTDLYAVGAVMFECLTGRPPFYSDYTIAMISRTLSTPAAFPENAPTGISAALRALVLSLLAKSPSDRPQRATDLLELIGELN
jgi:serine/threonine protein kinase